MNLMSCHGFLDKCPKRVLEYHLSKELNILEFNDNNLEKLTNDVKQRTYAEEIDNPDKVVTYINTILLNKSLYYYYIKT